MPEGAVVAERFCFLHRTVFPSSCPFPSISEKILAGLPPYVSQPGQDFLTLACYAPFSISSLAFARGLCQGGDHACRFA